MKTTFQIEEIEKIKEKIEYKHSKHCQNSNSCEKGGSVKLFRMMFKIEVLKEIIPFIEEFKEKIHLSQNMILIICKDIFGETITAKHHSKFLIVCKRNNTQDYYLCFKGTLKEDKKYWEEFKKTENYQEMKKIKEMFKKLRF